jgi:hypothetical protein
LFQQHVLDLGIGEHLVNDPFRVATISRGSQPDRTSRTTFRSRSP